jgi:hypothetical protein
MSLILLEAMSLILISGSMLMSFFPTVCPSNFLLLYIAGCDFILGLLCDHLLLRDLKLYRIIFMNICMCCYKYCHINAIKGLEALWENIYKYMHVLLLL